MSVITRKVYVCPDHGDVVNVIGMGKGEGPIHAAKTCGKRCKVVCLVPADDYQGAVEDRDKFRALLAEGVNPDGLLADDVWLDGWMARVRAALGRQ